jgi:hypothetical protein
MSTKVCVVLSTYNGQSYLDQQIQSVLDQSFQDFELWIRDDGSSDTTPALLKTWAAKDRRIRLWQQVSSNLGTITSFSTLLSWAKDFDYVLLCDQDDIWLPDHIQVLVKRAKEIESKVGRQTPLLVHSDLEVISESGALQSQSFRRALAPVFESLTLPEVLAQNLVTGCSSLANQALLKVALPVPRNCLMHDWWLALVAASSGQIVYVDRALTRYRQHAAQVSGGLGATLILNKILKLVRSPKQALWLMERRWAQTVLLEHQLSSRGHTEVALKLQQLLSEFCMSRLSALSACLNFGIRPQGFLRTCLYYFLLVATQARIKRLIAPFVQK